MKRSRDRLTGGTNDVNPQWLVINSLATTAGDTYTSQSVNLPVSRIGGTKSTRATVIEVLKVWFDMPSYPSNFTSIGQITQSQAQLSTAPLNTIQHTNPSVFAFHSRKWKGYVQGAGDQIGSASTWAEPEEQDLTDGDGHGIIIATDQIFFGVDTTGFAASVTFNCRILYRYKEIGLTEYIGIVQSQQNP